VFAENEFNHKRRPVQCFTQRTSAIKSDSYRKDVPPVYGGVVVVVLVVGPISTAAMKAYCTLTLLEFRHSSPEALHTKRRERPLIATDGTKAKEFS
jgi:hypothetical protein